MKCYYSNVECKDCEYKDDLCEIYEDSQNTGSGKE